MRDLTPAQKVRLQLEKNMTQDAIARAKRQKREATSILPTFMGENGNIKRLGQGESRAAIATNLHYGAGEEMRSIPVRGGLPMVDNRPRAQPTPVVATPEPPVVPIEFQYSIVFGFGGSGDPIGEFAFDGINPDTPASGSDIVYEGASSALIECFGLTGKVTLTGDLADFPQAINPALRLFVGWNHPETSYTITLTINEASQTFFYVKAGALDFQFPPTIAPAFIIDYSCTVKVTEV